MKKTLSVVFICSKTDAFWDGGWSTWLFLSWLGQVGDARVRTHQDVAGVQGTFQEALLGLRYVDAAQGSFGECVGGYKSQTVHTHLVDAVYGLDTKR